MRPWCLNPFLLSLLQEDDELLNQWKLYFSENYQIASIAAIWDSFKVYARTSLISHINKIKTDSTGAFDRAVAGLASTEQEYATNPIPATAAQLKLQSRVVTQLQFTKARQKLFFTKQKLFEQGEKTGKLLACLVHSEDRPTVVITLHGPGGQQITDPHSVTSMFREFFADLYKTKVTDSTDSRTAFLHSITLPQLKSDQVDLLEAPLTTDKIATAIASFERSKSVKSKSMVSLSSFTPNSTNYSLSIITCLKLSPCPPL